jgi:protein-S-isoprenylcysteine O-methyltransferase Ste14
MRASISDRTSPDSINHDRSVNRPTARIGAWLFRHRTAIPLPLAIALLLIPASDASWPGRSAALGVAITLAGEALRLWGVRHIGAISRTRSDRLGPLVDTGPFALVRNPLYVGNIALWVGFALTARLPWLAPVLAIVLALEYHAIVRWEEELLEARLGDRYRAYAARVPRWIPRARPSTPSGQFLPFSWRETVFSERGTLIAIAVGYALLWAKAVWLS